MAKKKVAILGGGVAGMSAAHELIERGFEVVVYESKDIPGGKARSMPKKGSGQAGRPDLPAEHGFRFFPSFYQHLPDTMERIPFQRRKTVFDNLIETQRTQMARVGQPELVAPGHFPTSLGDLATAFTFFFSDWGIPNHEVLYFVDRLLVLMTTCTERRFAEYEYKSWWEFVGAATRSRQYQRYLATGLTRTLVACRAESISTRTGGYILLQLMFDMSTPGKQVDRVLKGPTNDMWIQPWLDYLKASGVDYHLNSRVESIQCTGNRITGVTVVEGGARKSVNADYYIAALPVEVMQQLLTPAMIAADPNLAGLRRLCTNWMNGIMFYLDKDVSIVPGHSLYTDSPWALTSVSQRQFWPDYDLTKYGDGRVEGILSVDISDWFTPGVLYGKKAIECNRCEVKEEVWEQLKRHLNDDDVHELEDANVVDWFLDPAITWPNPHEVTNLEPLLINTAGSWDYRPDATTGISNLFLASDYVRTHTDLATMEAANEAARRAVNGILDASRSRAKPCGVWELDEPIIFEPLKIYDRVRFHMGLPHTNA